jgi:hypothetical protein
MIKYNEKLKAALLEEMQKVSITYRPTGQKWLWNTAEAYHKLMYDTLSLMVNFPESVSDEVNNEN